MRHIITLLLQNEAGALARVAGMFSSRGYNIDSLSVAPTEDPHVSRLTLVTFGSDAVVHQIVQQTRKVVDVVDIRDLSSPTISSPSWCWSRCVRRPVRLTPLSSAHIVMAPWFSTIRTASRCSSTPAPCWKMTF